MASLDYYEVLGISRDASADQINKAYIRLAKSTHPDLNEEIDASARFKKLSEAYDVLKDPKKRKAYDDKHISAKFRDVFSSNYGTWSVKPLKNVETNLEISLKEAYEGCVKHIKVKVKQPCKKCLSEGYTEFSLCNCCEGRGFKNVLQGFFNVQTRCSACFGEGKIPSVQCEDCGGSGSAETIEKYFHVNILAGIENESKIRAKGQGAESADGRCGDVIVSISVKDHDFIQRRGMDLLVSVDLSYTQLVLGCKLDLDEYILSDKSGLIEIPAGTDVGKRFKIEGLGMPSLSNPTSNGNLIVETGLKVPKKISKDHEKLLFDLFEIEKNE